MNKSDEIIHVFPYPEGQVPDNPCIGFIEQLYPTIRNQVERKLEVKSRRIYKEHLNWKKIYTLWSVESLVPYNVELINNLNRIKEILWWKKPIVFIRDSCFTNDLLLKELENILWDKTDEFLEIVDISYQDLSKNSHLSQYLYENSIVILWWSFSDLYNVPKELFELELANFIKDVHNNKINSKLIWICFWNQLISGIIWINDYFSERIITTFQWVAQFWMMPWKLVTSVEQIPYIYRHIVNSIMEWGWGNKVHYPLTRTGHVDFNLLDSDILGGGQTIVFVKDRITGSPIIWWTRNGNIIWNQAHYEINFKRDYKKLVDNIWGLVKSLQWIYWEDVKRVMENLERSKNTDFSQAEKFYPSTLLAFSESILKKHYFNKNKDSVQGQSKYDRPNKIIQQDDISKLICRYNFWENVDCSRVIENLDKKWFLRMSTIFDWKVNRWIKEVNKILWIDLLKFIKYHNSTSLSQWNYIVRDWWSWNWKLVNDIKNMTWFNTYWVSDYAYFDIYESLVNLDEFKVIPRNILKIFVQELILKYKKYKSWNTAENVIKAVNWIDLKRTTFVESTMFSETTYMFDGAHRSIDDSDKDFILNNGSRIDELKNYIKENFYDLIIWYFENTLISDFNSLYIPDWIIKKIDFQVAIRSTGHVDWTYLERILDDYTKISAKPWSVYIDNWVVRSYSWVPRISEYINLEQNNKDVKVYFIYDPATSYVTSAILLKEPFVDKGAIESFLDSWCILLTTEEIDSCSFFKIERFFRELMIFSFKNFQFFHDKNKEIIDFLKELSFQMGYLTIDEIKSKIINKINKLVKDVNKEYKENYTKITSANFEFYLSKVNVDIKELFHTWKINIPDWFNTDFERKN